MSGTCSSIEVYQPNTGVVSERFDSLDCLLNGLQDNTNNQITAKNVRDAVFSVWEKIEDVSNNPNVLFQSDELVSIQVGGIPVGASFSQPTTMQQMWDLLLYPELNPTLSNPSSTFTQTITGLREIGQVITISFTSTFTRGSISPQYQSLSQFRSGLPVSYQFNGDGIIGVYTSVSLSDTRNISNYEVVSGVKTWQGRVNYDAGVQPKSNKGNDFNTPLPSGSTNFISRTITGVYPFFTTSSDITILTKQTLVNHNSIYIEFDLQADSGVNKQRFQIPTDFSDATGIQQFNTISNQWEWLGGNQAASLTILNTQFTKTTIQLTINTYSVPYFQYVYNGSTIGFRKIRLYTN